ncbi:MAG TPA: cation diffusion facilitator family transporter [Bacteroidales bacterium]|nr:cation diffusion facilitator family transporter [Bacteroidales bacterium]
MKKESNSLRAILFALVGNFTIAVIKYIVSVISGSSAMLAEAIHSLADTTNQVFLLIGRKRSGKAANEIHSLGYGKEEYFWGFLVAVLLFFLGGCYSIYEGIHKYMNPEPIDNYIYIFIVLITSVIIEAKSFSVALTEFRKTSHKGLIRSLKDSTDTNIFVILIEDFSALTGLTIVIISSLLSLINPVFDIIGTFMVGCLLITMSYFLANELRKLIIGESISREMRNEVRSMVKKHEVVRHINNIRSMFIGNNNFILLISVDVADHATGSAIESMTEQVKSDILRSFPGAKYIYIDVNEE